MEFKHRRLRKQIGLWNKTTFQLEEEKSRESIPKLEN